MDVDFPTLVRRLRALRRRERLIVAELGGVPPNTVQNVALELVRNPTLRTVQGIVTGLREYDAGRRPGGEGVSAVHAE